MQKFFWGFIAGCFISMLIVFGIGLFNGRSDKAGIVNRASKVETVATQSIGIVKETRSFNRESIKRIDRSQELATKIRSENKRNRGEIDSSLKGIERIEAIIESIPKQ